MKKAVWIRIAFLFVSVFFYSGVSARADTTPTPLPVVKAVLFYSPTCRHCQQVINEVLPPIYDQYGEQLQVIGVDITLPEGAALFRTAIEQFQIEVAVVPLLIVDEHVLLGSAEIPQQFPGLIDEYLASGGMELPIIPGLQELIIASQATQNARATQTHLASPSPMQATPTTTMTTPSPSALTLAAPTGPFLLTVEADETVMARIRRDPIGNGMAIVILCGMLIVAVLGSLKLTRKRSSNRNRAEAWLFPLLCLAGLGVAGYLSYVETTLMEAYCGLVGDCNAVQQSEHARLFGILPIGILGVAGYLGLLAAWILQRMLKPQLAKIASLAILIMGYGGLAFSIYLTFLEPFVIGATCAWCLASALIMSSLFWLSLEPAKDGLARATRSANT